ncbi:hypothetical protein LL965_22420, partial [Xanthomonas cassavae CFBP 4642]
QVSVLCAHAATLRQGGVLHLEVESKHLVHSAIQQQKLHALEDYVCHAGQRVVEEMGLHGDSLNVNAWRKCADSRITLHGIYLLGQ